MARKRKTTKNEAVATTPDSHAPISESSYSAQNRSVATDPSQDTGCGDSSTSVSIQEKIELLAYSYWEERGKQGGSPEEDWYRAEKEILGQLGISDS